MSQNSPNPIDQMARAGIEAMTAVTNVERSRAKKLVDYAYTKVVAVCLFSFLGFEFIGDRLLTPGESTVGKYTAMGILAIVLAIAAVERNRKK